MNNQKYNLKKVEMELREDFELDFSSIVRNSSEFVNFLKSSRVFKSKHIKDQNLITSQFSAIEGLIHARYNFDTCLIQMKSFLDEHNSNIYLKHHDKN